MKKLIIPIILTILLSFVTQVYAQNKAQCKSKYGFSTDCIACHLPPTGELKLPNGIKRDNDTIYMSIKYMDFSDARDQFAAIRKYDIKKIIIDLFSYGGSLFDAMAMVSLIKEQQEMGRIIEIRGRGIIASAGVLIFISGDKGHRFIDKYSLLMFHELTTFKFIAVETPSDKEDETVVLRLIQNKINSYIANRTKISEKNLAEFTRKKEFWLDAEGCIKFGFADAIFNQ